MLRGRDIKFAIVLLSADDIGAARRQYDAEGVGERALQFRSRRNVILELGFFYGLLDWRHVFVLLKEAAEVYPNLELPPDLSGAVYDRIEDAGQWRDVLRDKLGEAGFRLASG
ncbi:nucleotide-binding protein [bacterium]|nr:nucleotide-binding protein [bacterium]MBU1073744.1 nucleotide-binding protein [bacterium]MBU1677118.1 nucleotide-binding protein [bacterium]